MVGTAGVRFIESRVAGVTLKIVEPLVDPEAAVIVLCPVAALAACPVLLIVATAGAELLQVTEPVISRVLPSVYVPVAANCWFVPNAIDGFAGVIAIETRAALVTVRVVEPLTVPELAAIVVAPVPFPVAKPALEIVATAGEDELQVTVPVMSCALPSV